MKILVVGGSGYVGGALTDLLKHDDSIQFAVFDNLIYEDRFLKKVDFVRGDIRDTETLVTIAERYDVVVWLAALVGDPLCALDENLTWEINTRSLERFALKFKGKMVFMSTCSVYGAQEGLLTESSDISPLSLYAKSKIESEKVLAATKPDSLIFRLGTLFGISDEFARLRADLVLNVLVMRAVYAGELTVFGGAQYRPLLHVKDVAGAIKSALINGSSGIYNLHCENTTIIELAKRIKHFSKEEIVLNVTETSFQDARNYSVSSEKAKVDFGFSPRYDVDFGIKEVFETLQQGRFPRILDATYSNVDKMRNAFVPIENSIVSQYFKGIL